ncbi:hypothetical protein, partial [Nocardia alni]|uniref:hypothetical protein n=1 Tax=Nocardia alni TaxID=2815723 RepID=UPI001C24D225
AHPHLYVASTVTAPRPNLSVTGVRIIATALAMAKLLSTTTCCPNPSGGFPKGTCEDLETAADRKLAQ